MRIEEIIERIEKRYCKEVTLVTHLPKPHHADDVTATALLQILFEDIFGGYGVKTRLVQTFKPREDGYNDDTPDTVVYDIGLGVYDHHQPEGHPLYDNVLRPAGGKYSSTGLLWKSIGKYLVPEVYVEDLYKDLFSYIDDADNGVTTNPLSTMIRYMNMYNPDDHDESFRASVGIMKIFIKAAMNQYKDKYAEYDEVKTIIDDCDGIVAVADKYYKTLSEEAGKALIPFVVFPDARSETGGYTFRTVTYPNMGMQDYIIPIPQKVRDWEGVNFLHPSGFLGTAVSKERAIEICELIAKDTGFEVHNVSDVEFDD